MGTETELMHVQAARASVQVAVDVPGSKSMTCRALVLAAISAQPVVLRGALRSDDTNALAHAISALGMSMPTSRIPSPSTSRASYLVSAAVATTNKEAVVCEESA